MKLITQTGFLQGLPEYLRKKWRNNVCGPACIAMITGDGPSKILEGLLELDGWDRKLGWKHSAIKEYLRTRGCRVYRIKFYLFPWILKMLLKNNANLFMASMNIPDGGHLVIVSQYNRETDSITCHDSGYDESNGSIKSIPYNEFLQYWRKYGLLINTKTHVN